MWAVISVWDPAKTPTAQIWRIWASTTIRPFTL